MANQNPSFGFTDYGSESADIERRRKYAEMLREQSMQPLEGGMAGGWAIPISPTQGLAKALQAYVGAKGMQKAKTDQQALADRRNKDLAQALGNFPQGTPGTAGVPEQTFTPGAQDFADNPNLAPNQAGQVQIPAQLGAQAQPASFADESKWLAQLAPIGPDAVAMGNSVLGRADKSREAAATRDARSADRLMALDAASQNAALSREERTTRAAEAAALRREIQASQQEFQNSQARQAALDRAAQAKQASDDRNSMRSQSLADRMAIAQQGRVPPGYRMNPDGTMAAIPGGPADLKAVQTDSGRGTVNNIVTQLRDSYDQLDKSGGITNPDKNAAQNVSAGIRSSGVGQFAGRMLGTQDQSLRNNIAQTRPLLLNAIKQATGMSAKQMDSNAEMKLYLQAATDPTLDIKANRQALDMLDKLYGLSGQQPAGATGTWSDAPPPGAVRRKQ